MEASAARRRDPRRTDLRPRCVRHEVGDRRDGRRRQLPWGNADARRSDPRLHGWRELRLPRCAALGGDQRPRGSGGDPRERALVARRDLGREGRPVPPCRARDLRHRRPAAHRVTPPAREGDRRHAGEHRRWRRSRPPASSTPRSGRHRGTAGGADHPPASSLLSRLHWTIPSSRSASRKPAERRPASPTFPTRACSRRPSSFRWRSSARVTSVPPVRWTSRACSRTSTRPPTSTPASRGGTCRIKRAWHV